MGFLGGIIQTERLGVAVGGVEEPVVGSIIKLFGEEVLAKHGQISPVTETTMSQPQELHVARVRGGN